MICHLGDYEKIVQSISDNVSIAIKYEQNMNGKLKVGECRVE